MNRTHCVTKIEINFCCLFFHFTQIYWPIAPKKVLVNLKEIPYSKNFILFITYRETYFYVVVILYYLSLVVGCHSTPKWSKYILTVQLDWLHCGFAYFFMRKFISSTFSQKVLLCVCGVCRRNCVRNRN